MEQTLEEFAALLKQIEQRLSAIERQLTSPDVRVADKEQSASPAQSKSASAREYILKLSPSDDNQRTLVMGSYLESKGQESFTVEDLKQVFREARLKLPANMNDKVNQNIAKGYLMDGDTVDGKKSWMLTMTGQILIENGLKEVGKNE